MTPLELNAVMGSISRQAGKLHSRSSSLVKTADEFRRSVAEVVLRRRRITNGRG